MRSIIASSLLLAACSADANTVAEQESLLSIPPEIAVPDGNHTVLEARGLGFQTYECQRDATGRFDWRFRAPIATLFAKDGTLVSSHFGGIDVGLPAGVYWQSTLDGSRVHGGKAVSVPNPGAVPLLRLEAADKAGEGIFANVSFIQRLETVGGLAPTIPCHKTGLRAFIPYAATYVFSVPSLPRPEVPTEIAVDDGFDVGAIGHATGVQIYDCALDTSGVPAWTFHAPRADLFDDSGLFIEHFGGIDAGLPAGAYWQSVRDGSRVHAGGAVASPVQGAIAQLRLSIADVAGNGILSRTSFIQRLNTVGGLAPAGTCDVGARVEVPYTADYFFYRPAN